jgi:alkyldihydroxyacetonephosphate synthase
VSLDRHALRWNGWGRRGEEVSFSAQREAWLLAQLERRLGRPLQPPPPALPLEDFRLPPGGLGEKVLDLLRDACGSDAVHTETRVRALHATGRSLPDLFRLRRGELHFAPDVVVSPANEAGVAVVLRIAADAHVAVVPIGGGSSVVGGVEARCSPHQAGVIALDTTRLDAVVKIDAAGGSATFQAGIDGPALEAALQAQGATLGHFPQSFEYSTLGGWIATRSSGQQSNGYGGIERLLLGVRVVTPEGILCTLPVPRSAAGPDLNEAVLGSEGTLGIIVEATLRVSPAPAHRDDRAILFHSFRDGVSAAREIVRQRVGIGLLRLSDAAETEVGLLQRHDPTRRFDATAWALGALTRAGWGEGRCLLLYGAEGGDRSAVRAASSRAAGIARSHGGFPLGRSPGRSWRRERFRTPYLRDWLLEHGVGVDTFETALPWALVEEGHAAIVAALDASAVRHASGGVAMAHLSHSYLDGACLYFTVLYPLDPTEELAQWQAIKRDVTDAIVSAGGTLSHHHGVGRDHAPWLAAEKGPLGMRLLAAMKQSLDPSGVMNPGKLL